MNQIDVKQEAMKLIEIKKELNNLIDSKNIQYNEPMKNHTSFKVGGPADVFISPSTIEELSSLVRLFSVNKIQFIVLGNGSNLIIKDGGLRGGVISLNNFKEVFMDESENLLYCDCGARLSVVANEALKNNRKGMEFASGIPGTIGGAVTMNAGAYGPEMKDVLEYAVVMNTNGEIFRLTNKEMEFSYRHSTIQTNNYIVLAAAFRLETGNPVDIKKRMDELNARRSDKQPLEFPSAGSTFKRPEGHFAAKLIEDCGLKGMQIGGAMISEKHSGFVINYDNSTAADILTLISEVQRLVFEKFGITLETEVKILGEDENAVEDEVEN
jgi:UDP-N-acetylmuramate dehydrogenase